MDSKQLVGKSIHHFKYKHEIQKKENVFQGRLKYVLEKQTGSKILVVVFSGFAGKGGARYNYMETLQNMKVNRLFILDDYGYRQKQGTYYLGEKGDFYVEKMVLALIPQVMEQLNASYLVTAGSSKGGSCAIYFGLKLKARAIIAGVPQYYLGDYLNTEEHMPILESIVGKNNVHAVGGVMLLNQLLSREVEAYDGFQTTIYLHYSNVEHTYVDHIQYLISDLRSNNINLREDVMNYQDHNDVALYFPEYLQNTLRACIADCEGVGCTKSSNTKK